LRDEAHGKIIYVKNSSLHVLIQKYVVYPAADIMLLFTQEKDRALQVSNIYSLRAKQNLEKATVNVKTSQLSSRKSAKNSDQDNNQSKLLGESPCQLKSTNGKPLSAGSTASIEDVSFHSDSTNNSIGSPKSRHSPRELSAKSVVNDLHKKKGKLIASP